MVDFTKKLKEQRAKEALDKQLAKVKASSAPNMNVTATVKKKKEEEPPPPDINDIEDIIPLDRADIRQLSLRHAEITKTQAVLKRQKKGLTADLKEFCKIYGLDRFMVEGNRASYYSTERSTISETLLLAEGIDIKTIKKCTVTKTVSQFRMTPAGEEEEGDDNGTE